MYCTANIKNDAIFWHRRLGHESFEKMNVLLNLKEKNSVGIYEMFLKGKQSTKPFKHISTRANNLLELIHSDVCEAINIGSRSFVTFIDDYSKRVAVFSMKTKLRCLINLCSSKTALKMNLIKKLKYLEATTALNLRTNNFESFVFQMESNTKKVHSIHHSKTVYLKE